jgi:sulfatase modifying factor 1
MALRRRTLAVAALVSGTLVLSCELLVDTKHLDSQTGATTVTDGGTDADGTISTDVGSPDSHASVDVGVDGPAIPESSVLGDSSVGSDDGPCREAAGPVMVRAGSYCIDSTEVTGADYAAFLGTDAGGGLEPPQCAWKHGSYDNGGMVNGDAGPAGNVDWCDAYVYCLWAGKRLCGAIGGGSAPYGAFADASVNQWFAACGGSLGHAYPYGATFEPAACNGDPDGSSDYTVFPVATFPGCVGGYPGLFDMSGNAAEWEDSCDESGGGDASAQPCHYRGGSAHSDPSELSCANPMGFGMPYARSSKTDDLGFRCCSP